MSTPGRRPIDLARVARMTRDIIAEYGLALELVGLLEDGTGWCVIVRDPHARDVMIAIAETASPATLRATLIRQLEAAAP